jgi:hypothetical protein
MDTEAIEKHLIRLSTREAAHLVALQAILAASPPALGEKLRRMAAIYGDLSLATSIPDEWRAEFQETLLSLADAVPAGESTSPLSTPSTSRRLWSIARWMKREGR